MRASGSARSRMLWCVLLTLGCGERQPPPVEALFDTTAVMQPIHFVYQTRVWGDVVPRGRVERPFLGVPGVRTWIGREVVEVYGFPSADSALATARRIPRDGVSFDPPVDWQAPPHFFGAGRTIVLYEGDDPDVLGVLRAVLGPQFSGAPVEDRLPRPGKTDLRARP